jgi:STE24 endopeptidase
MEGLDQDILLRKAKKYSAFKYTFAIINVIYRLTFLFIFAGSGLSRKLAQKLSNVTANHYTTVALYILIVLGIYYIVNFPLNLYSSYILEHKFSLSRQKIRDWFRDQLKTGIIHYGIIVLLTATFYYIVKQYSHSWWWIVSLIWIFFSFILTKLSPVVIMPLFFKYTKLSDENLRERIFNLADKMKVKTVDVFQINFSKKTLKANAALVGLGNTKRVILADTLKDKYSADEIEVILAHEFAHYKLNHLVKLILMNSLATILVFYLVFKTSDSVLKLFGFSSLLDIAAFPVLVLYLVVFGMIMKPLWNYISRRFEKNADKMALSATGLKGAFVSIFDKLSNQNLADRNPHPVIKFLFFRCPAIDERITMAKSS